jgi:NAD(P)-dependent dehydrogenase (short-subunit alcohol dehydrogenase family)
LNFAFNNAGVFPGVALLADIDEAAFDQVVAVDLKGVFLAMKYAICPDAPGPYGAARWKLSSCLEADCSSPE